MIELHHAMTTRGVRCKQCGVYLPKGVSCIRINIYPSKACICISCFKQALVSIEPKWLNPELIAEVTAKKV
jgi:hypothetical protein